VKLVVLAAGYATRLYPLTLDRPKHLLEVAGRPILDHVLEKLASTEGLDGIYVVTNSKFAPQFREWASGRDGIEIVDDGTTSEETKLGAVGDLGLLVRRGLADEVIVVAGDNLFTESLVGFGRFGRERGAPAIGVYDVGALEPMRGLSVIELDADDRVVSFDEKPVEPRSTLAGIALYYYPRETLPLVLRYLDDGKNPDQPGLFVQWLYTREHVYGWRVPGLWFDIGTPEMLDEADRTFRHELGTEA
jgi:glucose-1-phosphate thymidylyltransferase